LLLVPLYWLYVIVSNFITKNKVLDDPDIRIMSFFMIINYYARCYSIIHNSLLSSSQVYINRRYLLGVLVIDFQNSFMNIIVYS
jgi:hypothetical protein